MSIIVRNKMSYFVTDRHEYALACRLSPPEFLKRIPAFTDSEFVRAAKEHFRLPPAFSLRPELTPVEDQARRGTCVAFCVNAVLEYITKMDLSEQFTYWISEMNDDDNEEGLPLTWTCDIIRREGTVEEKYWDYSLDPIPGNPAQDPPPAEALKAPRIKFKTVHQIDPKSVPALKSAIAEKHLPIHCAVPVFWSAGWDYGPDITMPSKAERDEWQRRRTLLGNPDGLHAVPLVGYDDYRGRFVFKNGWSDWWGDAGYGTLPYEYITQLCAEACVTT